MQPYCAFSIDSVPCKHMLLAMQFNCECNCCTCFFINNKCKLVEIENKQTNDAEVVFICITLSRHQSSDY